MVTARFSKILGESHFEYSVRIGDFLTRVKHAESLWSTLEQSLLPSEVAEIQRVRLFAQSLNYKHMGLSPEEYFLHPIRVASLVGQLVPAHKVLLVQIALVHNIFEVSDISDKEVVRVFGIGIYKILKTLQIDRAKQSNDKYLKAYYSRISQLPKNAAAVKVIDKFDNLLTLRRTANVEQAQQYLAEIKNYIFPLCVQAVPSLRSSLVATLDFVTAG